MTVVNWVAGAGVGADANVGAGLGVGAEEYTIYLFTLHYDKVTLINWGVVADVGAPYM